jgi:hypothetical protein
MEYLKKPTPELVEKALARLGRPGANAYFFDRLKNPSWIEPLAARGFFKRPPEAERFPAEGTVSFPDWPELRYLQRMAVLAPELVGKLATAVPTTDNVRVHEILAHIGSKLPKPWAQKIGRTAESWLDEPILRAHFGEAFAELIAQIARVGDHRLALKIAKKFFAVEAEAKAESSSRAFSSWHFEMFAVAC